MSHKPPARFKKTATITVTQEHIDAVTTGTDFVKQKHDLHGGELMAEQRVPIGHFTGEEGAEGTTDVLILTPKTLFVDDFKYGRSKVYAYEVITPAHRDIITGETVPEVVRANLQMACYALGAVEKYGLFHDWTHVTMTIIQPFVGHVSEYTCTIEELMDVRDFLAAKAEETRTNPQYVPSPSGCHFCRASGDCKAQKEMVVNLALEGFGDIETAKTARVKEHILGDLYAVIGLVSDWCSAVSERVRATLTSGEPVIRSDGLSYKLVDGRMGPRAWKDKAEAEKAMLSMRLGHEHIYEQSIISPTTAEKLAKVKKAKKGEKPVPPVIGPTKWNRLQELITQSPGQASIALETDPRPAVSTTDGFEEVTTPNDNSDLF